MPDIPDPQKTSGVFKKMQKTAIQISPSQKIPAIHLNAPQELIDIFIRRLDSSPFAGRLIFPGKTYSVSLFHRARSSLVRVIVHPDKDEVDPEHIVFLLRYKLFEARANADLHSIAESRFSSKIIFELAAYSLPPCHRSHPSSSRPDGALFR